MRWFKQILLLRLPEEEKFEILESLKKGGDENLMQFNLERVFENERMEGRKEGIEKGRKEGIEKGRKEGIEKGRKEGIEKGRKERNIEIAEKLLKIGLKVSQVAQSTDLSEEEVVNIKMQLKL